MILFFATIIALAAAATNGSDTAQISKDSSQANHENESCQTPACLQAADTILKNMDSTVNPCNDFYKFACGNFVEQSIIPDTQTSVSILEQHNDQIKEQLQRLIPDRLTEDNLPIFKVMKNYYETCMDTDEINKNSKKNLEEDLKTLGGCPILEKDWIEENFDWKKSMYESSKLGYSTSHFFQIYADYDPDNSTMRILNVDQAWTELPYDNLMNGKDDELVTAFSKIVLDILEYLGADRKQAEKEVESVVDFDIALAKISLSTEERQDKTKLNNRMTLSQLETNYTGIPWTEFINEILASYVHLDQSDDVILNVPSFFKHLPELIANTPKRVLANYVCVRAISEVIDYLGEEFLSIKHEGNKPLAGAQEQKSRKEVCFENLYATFYPAIGRLYVKHYFDKNAKTMTADLVKNFRNSLHHMIEQANWMDSKTKSAALHKLDAMDITVGYPDELESDEKMNEIYPDLKIDCKSYARCELLIKQYQDKKIFSRLKKPVKKTSWINYSDAQATALHFRPKNSFGLSAGYSQGYFYNSSRPNYLNYGAIGFVIAREISHAFDDEGSQYDARGNLVNWWEDKTREEYSKKAKCIIDQYGNYTVKEVNKTIDGIITQSENIADNVGVRTAYLAYNEWAEKNGKEPQLPDLDYTPQQMFWISFANGLCEKVQPNALEINMDYDTTAPAEYRVIGSVSNMPEFSRDFKCSSTSPMNPVKKCSFW